MRANPGAFREFFTDADFARHLDAVSRLNAEAGQHEVSAASKAYGRSIVVHQNREDAAPVIFYHAPPAATSLH